MKTPRIVSVVLLCAVQLVSASSPKVSIDQALQTAYEHFVGTWTGTDVYRSDHGMITVPVALTVTETKNQKSLRFDYVYSSKGKKDYSKATRFVVLEPAKGKVILNWEHEPRDNYTAIRLGEFVRTGYGIFAFSNSWDSDGVQHASRCTFRLAQDSFSYAWEESAKGSEFQVMGTWKLVRVAPASQADSSSK